ncbi:hypothetical protein N9J39_00250 [Flavicella sp.]|jgi:hypothetical protein|nr:hypothetical protein [Flavicella sp.]MDA9111286.1 hypothetical protein [Flavicella sp.]
MIKIAKTGIVGSFWLLVLSCGGDSEPLNPSVASPKNPVLAKPLNAATCFEGTPLSETISSVDFQWSADENSESYELTIVNLNTNLVVTKLLGIETNTIREPLTKGIPYAWTVTAKSSKTEETGESDLWTFFLASDGIVNYAPFPAALLTPKSGETLRFSGTASTFSWTGSDPDSDSVLTYTLYLDRIDGMQNPSEERSNLTAQSVDVSLEPNANYFWRVKTSDGSNNSYSSIYRFKTE